MILISCVENALGLRFNHRRCSRTGRCAGEFWSGAEMSSGWHRAA